MSGWRLSKSKGDRERFSWPQLGTCVLSRTSWEIVVEQKGRDENETSFMLDQRSELSVESGRTFSFPLFPIVLCCQVQSIISFHTRNVSTTRNFFSFESIPLKMMRKWPSEFLSSQVVAIDHFGDGFSNSQQRLATRF